MKGNDKYIMYFYPRPAYVCAVCQKLTHARWEKFSAILTSILTWAKIELHSSQRNLWCSGWSLFGEINSKGLEGTDLRLHHNGACLPESSIQQWERSWLRGGRTSCGIQRCTLVVAVYPLKAHLYITVNALKRVRKYCQSCSVAVQQHPAQNQIPSPPFILPNDNGTLTSMTLMIIDTCAITANLHV